MILAALTVADAIEIQQAVITKAKRGDLLAARIVLDRISPVPRGRTISFPMPKVDDTGAVLSAHAAMLEAVSTGVISVDEGVAISGLLTAQLKMIEATVTEARLRAIEEQLANAKH